MPSLSRVSGSHTMQSNMLGILPLSTGPADCPWNLWIVLAYARHRGVKILLQHGPFWDLLQQYDAIGMGTCLYCG